MSEDNHSSIPIVVAIITVLGGTGIALLTHRLSKRREAATRLAAACTLFRQEVQSAVMEVPAASKHWENEVLLKIPTAAVNVEVAAKKLAPFLPEDKRRLFLDQLGVFKRHCADGIPKALSAAEIVYGGGQPMAEVAKQKFHAGIAGLLGYAKET